MLSTVDVDSAYAYRGKGFKRTLGGFWGDLKRGDAANRRLRWQVLRGKQPDPFDTYETILQEHARHSIPPLFFFLVADFDRPHDINLSHRRPALRALVLELADRAEVGAHPGYRAAESAERLALEIGRVADLKLGQVDHTRYHYLRGHFPKPLLVWRTKDCGTTTPWAMRMPLGSAPEAARPCRFLTSKQKC